jgi:hypothetical protein
MSDLDVPREARGPCRLLVPRTPVRERRWGFWQRLRFLLLG